MAPRKPKACQHQAIIVDASEYGRAKAGFIRVPPEKRVAGTTLSGRVQPMPANTSRPYPNSSSGPGPGPGSGSDNLNVPAPPVPSTFPGPLVLPDDDLALEPRYPPQSLRSWAMGQWRNPITPAQKTLYVADVPRIDESAAFMRGWALPDLSGVTTLPPGFAAVLEHPRVEDVVAYFAAFYHPLPVAVLPTRLRFVKWDDENVPPRTPRGGSGKQTKKPKPMVVGLAMGDGEGVPVVGIRCRPGPDGLARMQLNLNDLLSALRGVLPGAAYAACMLVAQDLYEDENDDFCCGRAFGGSRICTVSSFRYRPVLDSVVGVEREHMWPASHCGTFVVEACEWWEEQGEMLEGDGDGEGRGTKGKGKKKKKKEDGGGEIMVDLKRVKGTAMGGAIAASRDVLVPREASRDKRQAEEDLKGMWFARVARTAAHEVGHCLGMDHCVYYACVMQGTGGLGEDGRQPPYFCPVCEAKFIWGLGEMGIVDGGRGGRWVEGRMAEVERKRMEIMRGFCEGWKGVGMFAGYRGWLDARLRSEFRGGRALKEDVEVIVID
ncbi:hypothetical protein CORC01_01566 [Colletotrichum orchidophilum]|uniref:Archaemetzincin-2 n=1 Tax=Colletotrichum orchidophilum TaxID=1209926 RepID=A0A1G4BNZ9_9PEZI|nr:uncharacterized protein CORC01_01566 [Colletotrichum orchidophilum]OHF03182.1 hypothetical protein CORC01_01566 [Colletotrichum orchidophilum]